MIIQVILDWFANTIAQLIGLIPPLPTEVASIVTTVTNGAAGISTAMGKLQPIVPYDVISGCLTIWVSLLAFWLAVNVFIFVMRMIRG